MGFLGTISIFLTIMGLALVLMGEMWGIYLTLVGVVFSLASIASKEL
jgi:hypothetical protein